jgi:RND family efflux transporter MFP subunit
VNQLLARKGVLIYGGTGVLVLAGLLLIGIIVGAHRRPLSAQGPTPPEHHTDGEAEDGEEAILTVKTILPKQNSHELVRSVSQPAFVQALYQVELMARVAGPVKMIEKNLGDPIAEGEVLVELDVPELVQDVAHKEALVRQAEQDARMAEANVAVMAASARESKSQITEREAQVKRAEANKRFREAEYRRFRDLVAEKGALPIVLDERLRELEASIADWQTAQVAVETAKANAEEFTAKVEAAKVDVDVKKARVAVARAELGRAQAMVEFAKIRAPFTGMIAARHVHPGAFIQNASTGSPKPVLTVVRTDIVTLVMYVPEKEALRVRKGMEAVIHFDALPGREFRAPVTRVSNWLDPTKSRDMRVEVDLPNPKQTSPPPRKGMKPHPPEPLLRPGMYGSMTVILEKFDHVFLVPTSAVFERRGKTHIFEVRDGKAHLVPVLVQMEDGIQAKIVRRLHHEDPKTGHIEEVYEDLRGDEEILRSGQGEIADGQPVKTIRVNW